MLRAVAFVQAEVCGGQAMRVLLQDLGYAFRQLRKTPGFTVTVLLTLALGIGANSAIFTLVNAILLHNLPVTDPKTLDPHRRPGRLLRERRLERQRGLLALFHRHLLHVQEEPAGVRRAGRDGVRLRVAAHYRSPRGTADRSEVRDGQPSSPATTSASLVFRRRRAGCLWMPTTRRARPLPP